MPIESLLDTDVAAVVAVSGEASDPQLREFMGTGFLIGPGIFMTCWHCVSVSPQGARFAALFHDGSKNWRLEELSDIERDPKGRDLATASVSAEPRRLTLSPTPALVGDDVWTVGHVQTSMTQTGLSYQAQLLRTYITRIFKMNLAAEVLAYELGDAAPQGLSGAPVMVRGHKEVIGVVFASQDFQRIVEFAVKNEERIVSPEVVRITSFGLAHYTDALWELRGKATQGLPLSQLFGG